MWTRRNLLQLGVATAGNVLLSRSRAAASLSASGLPTQKTPRKPPRYTVVLVLGGGMDAIWTTDPKRRNEVAPDIDVPYGPEQIGDNGHVQFGPHLAPLAKHYHRFAVINGVQVQTANHITGQMQMLRMKTRVHRQMPAFLDIIGSRRDSQPLACMSFGAITQNHYNSGFFGAATKTTPAKRVDEEKELFSSLDEQQPADLEMMAEVLRRQAAQLRRTGGSEYLVSAGNLEQTAALFTLLPKAKPFAPEPWSPNGLGQYMAECLQRVLWAFENDLTSCAFVAITNIQWDSHQNNVAIQTLLNGLFAAQLARFVDQLDTRRNAHGVLAANTLLLAGSEIGRFPRINQVLGKDHFPQVPYLLMGPSINTRGGKGAVFGRTGKQTEALPISLRTGVEGAGAAHIPLLDDLGTTLLYAAGFDPSVYGYGGRILEFLLDA